MSDVIVILMEIWSPVVGYEGRYAVSTMGRVKNVRRDKLIVPLNAKGYRRVCLYINGIGALMTIHSLVCAAFVGARPMGYHINHKNGVRNDNTLESLEYCTVHEKAIHASRVLHRRS